jgi:nitrite reductase/ring-hydroxylating ferredoxin subunit
MTGPYRHALGPEPGAYLCRLDEVPDGGAREVAFGEGRDAYRVLLLRRGGMVWGYRNVCPHFSLPLNYEPQGFLTEAGETITCAHHGATYRFEDGRCLDGPCTGAALDALPVRNFSGRLHVDGGPQP